MQYMMTFNLLPTSVNSNMKTTKGGRVYKSGEAKKITKQVKYMIDEIYPHVKESINERFDPKRHCFSVEFYFYTRDFYTKKKEVSHKSGDVDNRVKNIQDDVFKAIGIDDRYVTELRACKLPADELDQTIVFINIEYLDQFVKAPYDRDPDEFFEMVELDSYL